MLLNYVLTSQKIEKCSEPTLPAFYSVVTTSHTSSCAYWVLCHFMPRCNESYFRPQEEKKVLLFLRLTTPFPPPSLSCLPHPHESHHSLFSALSVCLTVVCLFLSRVCPHTVVPPRLRASPPLVLLFICICASWPEVARFHPSRCGDTLMEKLSLSADFLCSAVRCTRYKKNKEIGVNTFL